MIHANVKTASQFVVLTDGFTTMNVKCNRLGFKIRTYFIKTEKF